MLQRLFYNMNEKNDQNGIAQMVVNELLEIWNKACIPTHEAQHCITKLKLYMKVEERYKKGRQINQQYRDRKKKIFVFFSITCLILRMQMLCFELKMTKNENF